MPLAIYSRGILILKKRNGKQKCHMEVAGRHVKSRTLLRKENSNKNK